eukprot:831062-Pelagomonas_calceolata.AAC.1
MQRTPCQEGLLAPVGTADAKEAFKELLASVGTSPDWTWEQTMRLIDQLLCLKYKGNRPPLFQASAILLAHGGTVPPVQLDVALLLPLCIGPSTAFPLCMSFAALPQARDDFFHLILESAALKTTHGFRRAKELFEENPRWKAVPEREREELFHEAQKEKAGREKEERRQEKKRRTSAFRELLERTPGIKVGKAPFECVLLLLSWSKQSKQACDAKACDAKACGAKACDAKACDAKKCDAKACDAKACGAKDAEACGAKACGAKACHAKACDAKAPVSAPCAAGAQSSRLLVQEQVQITMISGAWGSFCTNVQALARLTLF